MLRLDTRLRWMGWTAAVIAPLLAAGPPARAADGQDLKLSGFGTLGLAAQSVPDGWGFNRNIAQPGRSEKQTLAADSRAGLQLDWRPQGSIEGTVQFVLFDRPPGASASERVEWAYLGWRPTPNSRLRLGRTSPDSFLFTNSRHVGYALPWVRPPVDMYGFLPIASLDGVEGSRQWTSGDASWLVRGAAGRFRVTTAANVEGGSSLKVQADDTMVLTVQRQSGGLLIKASTFKARLSLNLSEQLGALTGALGQIAALPLPGLGEPVAALQSALWGGGRVAYRSLGLQHDSGPWLLVAEAGRLKSSPGNELTSWRGYVSLGYRWHDMTFFGLLGRARPDRPPVLAPQIESSLAAVVGPAAAAQLQGALNAAEGAGNSYRQDQATASVGVRWDVSSNMALKFQLDRVHVRPHGAAMWRTDGRPRDAHNTIGSLALDFVWGQ